MLHGGGTSTSISISISISIMTLSFPLDRKADEAAEDAAINWLVELRSGVTDAATRQAFDTWLQADVRHRQAWSRLGQAVDTTLGPIREGGGMAIGRTLNQAAAQSTKRRRLLSGALLFAGTAVGTGWMMRGSPFINDWPADLYTGTARRQTFTLPDGSLLTLNARSSADIDFNRERRLVRLRQGDLVIDVVDPARLPFIVQSRHGDVRVLGSRLMVGLAGDVTRTLAMRDDLDITPRQVVDATLVRQGQAAQFDEQRVIRLPQAVPGQAAAWLDGKLLAFDQPLGEVVDALRPYRGGLLRISAQAAALRVTGNYSLDQPAQTLRALGETLPIHIAESAGGLLTRITLQATA